MKHFVMIVAVVAMLLTSLVQPFQFFIDSTQGDAGDKLAAPAWPPTGPRPLTEEEKEDVLKDVLAAGMWPPTKPRTEQPKVNPLTQPMV